MEKGQQIFLWLTQHSPETKTKTKTIILGLAKQCHIFHLIPGEAQCVKSISAHTRSVGCRRFIGDEPIFVPKGDNEDDGSISSCGWGEQCLDIYLINNCIILV